MRPTRYRLTDEVWRNILAFVRAGGYPHVAAEAAGVPRETFEAWLARGDSSRRFRKFRDEVLQAQAVARLNAEIKVLKEDPLQWLRSGPGRETGTSPGWTQPAKAGLHQGRVLNALMQPEVQALLALIMQVLAPYPEARSALALAISRDGDVQVINAGPGQPH
jgi:hypothetical protein